MTATTINICNRDDRKKVLFSHTCEDNTIRKTVEAAIEVGIKLAEADFSGADLHGADLSLGNFREANFAGADLSFADFRGANLFYANVFNAFLLGANLRDATFYGSNLSNANWVADKPETTAETIQKSRYLRTQFALGKYP